MGKERNGNGRVRVFDRRQEREGWEGGTEGMGGMEERNGNGGRI